MFKYIENVFPEEVIDSLNEKYCAVKDDDLSSHDMWINVMTLDRTLPENHIQNFSMQDRIKVLALIHNDPKSPFYKDNRIKHADISAQKITVGSHIPKHVDRDVSASLTVFLNKEYDTDNGGEAIWWENETTEESYSVIPKYNCGIWATYEDGVLMPHAVSPVNVHTRTTIQVFVWQKNMPPGKVKRSY